MDERFEMGCQFFNDRKYFEAHEIWEDIWVEASGARHAFLQCLIQVAVALHHASNQNWKGTRKLCSTALGYLEKGRSDSQPIDMDQLKDRILDIELSVQEIEAGRLDAVSAFELPVLNGTR